MVNLAVRIDIKELSLRTSALTTLGRLHPVVRWTTLDILTYPSNSYRLKLSIGTVSQTRLSSLRDHTCLPSSPNMGVQTLRLGFVKTLLRMLSMARTKSHRLWRCLRRVCLASRVLSVGTKMFRSMMSERFHNKPTHSRSR